MGHIWMLILVGFVNCQTQLEPAYLKETFFAKQNKVAIPDIPSSIREPALSPLAPISSKLPPPGLSVFDKPTSQSLRDGKELPRKGKSAQEQLANIALGPKSFAPTPQTVQLQGINNPSFGSGQLVNSGLPQASTPLIASNPHRFSFQPQVSSQENIRFLQPSLAIQPSKAQKLPIQPLSQPLSQPLLQPSSPQFPQQIVSQPQPQPALQPKPSLAEQPAPLKKPLPPPHPSQPLTNQPILTQPLVQQPPQAQPQPSPPTSQPQPIFAQPQPVPSQPFSTLLPRFTPNIRPSPRPFQNIPGQPNSFISDPTLNGLAQPLAVSQLNQPNSFISLGNLGNSAQAALNQAVNNAPLINPTAIKPVQDLPKSVPTFPAKVQLESKSEALKLIPQPSVDPIGSSPLGPGELDIIQFKETPILGNPSSSDISLFREALPGVPVGPLTNPPAPPSLVNPESGPRLSGAGLGLGSAGPLIEAVPAVPAIQPLNTETKIGELNVEPLIPENDKVQLNIIGNARPKVECKPTFVEECKNEYKMVCVETTVDREKPYCETVLEDVCETGIATDYEPACFQQIINHCDGVCKRDSSADCRPACERSLAPPYCHRVKVVSPTRTCNKVSREQCGTRVVSVPYEKCHDEPTRVCQQVQTNSCPS